MDESLKTGKFDCDNSSFLVYDIAKLLGMNASLIYVPNAPRHAFVAFKKFFFETTNGKYYPMESMLRYYPINQILTESQIQSITYLTRSRAYYRVGNYERAIEDCTKAIELNPDGMGTETYLGRGGIYWKQGKYKEAIEDFTKAIDSNPNNADAYYIRGISYGKRGEYKEAIEDCTKAIKLNPNYAEAYENRADAYEKTKRLDLAKKDRETAKRIKRYE